MFVDYIQIVRFLLGFVCSAFLSVVFFQGAASAAFCVQSAVMPSQANQLPLLLVVASHDDELHSLSMVSSG